jgi:hypothetical protein
MELLEDMGHVESHFSPLEDYVSVGAYGDNANLEPR